MRNWRLFTGSLKWISNVHSSPLVCTEYEHRCNFGECKMPKMNGQQQIIIGDDLTYNWIVFINFRALYFWNKPKILQALRVGLNAKLNMFWWIRIFTSYYECQTLPVIVNGELYMFSCMSSFSRCRMSHALHVLMYAGFNRSRFISSLVCRALHVLMYATLCKLSCMPNVARSHLCCAL